MDRGFALFITELIIKTIDDNIKNIIKPSIDRNRNSVSSVAKVSLVNHPRIIEYVRAGVMTFDAVQKKYAQTFEDYMKTKFPHIETTAVYDPNEQCVIVSMSWKSTLQREFNELIIDVKKYI